MIIGLLLLMIILVKIYYYDLSIIFLKKDLPL